MGSAPVRQVKVQVGLFHVLIVQGNRPVEHAGLRQF